MATAFKDAPKISWLPDGKRLQMRHGPIDLIVYAEGGDHKRAYKQAAEAFNPVLHDLVGELDILRSTFDRYGIKPLGKIARNMLQAAGDLGAGKFVTPMIAVAGAVADHVLAAMCNGTGLQRAFVNNGGDIALYLAGDRSFEIGICANPEIGAIDSTARIQSSDRIGGIATSGWRGRSHSLGIADSVTVLARDAAHADVAATLIANAVDVPGHVGIKRLPANELSPDSDLGTRMVTVDVAPMSAKDIQTALSNGRKSALKLLEHQSINGVFIALQSEMINLSPCETATCSFLPVLAGINQSILSDLETVYA